MSNGLHADIIDGGDTGATPLVLLHGLFGDRKNLAGVARALSDSQYEHEGESKRERVCCHCLDLPNHGDSPHLPDMHFEHMLPLLEDYIAGLPAPVSLLGHSLGGKMAMLYACRHPERVRHLIVADIAPKQNPPNLSSVVAALTAVDLQVASRKQIEEQLAQHIPAAPVRLFLLKGLRRRQEPATGFEWRFNLDAIARHPEQWLENSLSESDRYDMPCHFIYGEESDYVNTDAARSAVLHHFPQARLIPLASAGHWVHADQPQGFVAVVESILMAGG